MISVDFATFVYAGDAHRLHAPGQLKKQVDSNGYAFDNVIVIYQKCNSWDYNLENIDYQKIPVVINNINEMLTHFGISLEGQYQSPTDSHHTWKPHIVNHLAAIQHTAADYIVFADNDCWIIRQPDSWVSLGIEILKNNPDIFIISPNDGESERKTQRMSQQMFLVKVNDFRNMDLNQPGFDFEVTNHPEMPEYHAMLEGRMHYYCKSVDKYRYVLGPEYRYFHHNRLTEDGMFDTDYKKLGWV